MAIAGMRVMVPFSRYDKLVEGVILSVTSNSKCGKLKVIESFVDERPLIDEENIKLALWMSDRFFCTVYDALRAMLPVKLKAKKHPKSGEKTTSKLANMPEMRLSDEQSAVFDEIVKLFERGCPSAVLLYGITGSGKTLIYIKLIEAVLAQNKTAIVLVPEIALTPQTVRIFKSHFGGFIAVLHSALPSRERYTEWTRISGGEVKVVIGTRSAVFAPLKNIGLIVIDEEQEHTYKSESSPRYHAREVAKYRVTRSSGMLLMASATPSIDSMYAAKTGKYKLFRLDSRFNEKGLPSVIVVDMKNELRAGNGGAISSVLREELRANIQRGEQSILFINRRGASPIVTCGECGYTYRCKKCSVSMTYHTTGMRLLCHYCGYTIPVGTLCPKCSGKLMFIGSGTQKVEQELSDLFPDVGIIRMDADTTMRKNAHNKLLSQFRGNEAHILLGTQMVTKGLDFENVTLVGVLSADQSLYMSDFRANERTFSLITQVVGRSGRGKKPGRAVIQTFTPENKIIEYASKQDYDIFYDNEIALRQALGSPPVRDLLVITVTGAGEAAVAASSSALKVLFRKYFEKEANVDILGPAPAPMPKINNKYIYRILLNCENSKHIRAIVAHGVKEFSRGKKPSGVTVYADVDMC